MYLDNITLEWYNNILIDRFGVEIKIKNVNFVFVLVPFNKYIFIMI